MEVIYHRVELKSIQIEEALTAVSSVEGFKAWWTTGTRLDAQGRFEFHFTSDYYKTFERVEDQNSVRFICLHGDPEWVNTEISFQFEASDSGLILHFRHTGWASLTEMYGRCNYHWALYLRSLLDHLSGGMGKPAVFDIE